MTKPQACEWVHTQLILIELDARQLVQAFTALTNGAPNRDDRRYGLFRRCCEIVIASAPPAAPDGFAAPDARPASERGVSRAPGRW